MALTVTQLSGRSLATDTLLGVTAHGGLALGLVVASFLSGVRIDLMAYLFGDILAVTRVDLLLILIGFLAVILLMYWRWSKMLISTLNEELAYSNGINPIREKFFLTISLAITVAVSIKVVGLLLISALLIIPAAASRTFSRTPEEMVIITAIIGVISAISGLQFSYLFNTPPGPSIVCVSLAVFLILSSIRPLRSN